MAKHSFVFCKMCKTMFLKSEVKDNCCPGCKCNYGEHLPEEYELDPFKPQSWSFAEMKLQSQFHSQSTNEQFEYTDKELFSSVRTVYFICCVIIIVISFALAWELLLLLGFVIVQYLLIVGVLGRALISVDCNNVYLLHRRFGVFKKEKVIPRKDCIVQLSHYRKGTDVVWNVDLVYVVDGGEKVEKIFRSFNEQRAVRTTRWFSAFIKYAYDEDLLPEPEMKYGKALPVGVDDGNLSVDEGEKLIVQDEM